MEKKFISLKKAMSLTSLSRSKLYQLRKQNKLRWYSVGKKILILESSIYEYLDAHCSQFKSNDHG